MPPSRSVPPALRGYFRGRISELARPETRAVSEPLAAWAQRRVRLDGKPFSFEDHEYLRAIYDDTGSHVVLCKAAQIGGTIWAVLRAVHACVMGLNVMYFFPTRTDVLEFSKSRVGPLLADNPFLSRLLKDTDTAGLKRIGNAHLHFRGMQSTVGLKGVPADVLVLDELDEATPEAKAMAKERLSHSDYKRLIELSNPSLPNYGIDEAFQRTDQRHWTLRCDHCGYWTAPVKAFPTSLGQEVRIIRKRQDGTHYLACLRCSGELDLAAGEWIADFPDRPSHGYLISQLISARIDPGEILEEYQRTRFPERFYNLKIGIPWADVQNRLDRAAVLACAGEHGMLESAQRGCTMGVDTGKVLHVVVSQPCDRRELRRIVYIGTCQEYAELDDLMRRYQVTTCVIDALPEIHATRQFAERHSGRVWLNYFQENQRGSYRWDAAQQIVAENKTEAMDASRRIIRERRVLLPRAGRLLEEFADHLSADVKRLDEDQETGARAFRYIRTAVNHYSLAFTYDCIAWSRDTGEVQYARAWSKYDPPIRRERFAWDT